MRKYFQCIRVMGFLFITSLYLVGCADDDVAEVVLPYNSSEHIYGTFGYWDDGFWEVVIDPATGGLSKIIRSEETFPGRSPRTGAFELTSFKRNERIYSSPNSSTLKVQNLETLNITDIVLRDNSLDQMVIYPQLLRFGADQNEVYLMDTDNSIWKIDINSQVVRKVHDGIPIAEGTYITDLFYIASTGHFLVMTNNTAANAYTADNIFLFNPVLPDAVAMISATAIASGFGFAQHPDEPYTIYFIQQPQDDKGFRLMKISMTVVGVNVSEISRSDLPIDNLSVYLQTIHTASNTYIIRSGSGSIERPSNTLYSIDLSKGDLVREVEIREAGILLKLAGE